MKYQRALKFSTFAILLSITGLVYSMPDDREKVVELSADYADLSQETHRGEYQGHVTFDQGTTHLRADKAITEGNRQNKLTLAMALGSIKDQAHYWTQTSPQKPLLHAYADKIRYYPEKHLVELIGNAKITQGDNSFSGPKISYDTVKQHVISKGDAKNKTIIIIHPEKKNG